MPKRFATSVRSLPVVAFRLLAHACLPIVVAMCGVGPRAIADDVGETASALSVLERHCVRCHSGEQAKGGLSLDTRAGALAGGDSGPALTPGDFEQSLLVDYISGESPEMPKDAPPLTDEALDSLRKWIDSGAAWPDGVVLVDRHVADTDWWSLRPLALPAVPDGPHATARTPVDRFIQAKLAEHALIGSSEADRRTLIRRLYFDLTGLPPARHEVESFAADQRPDSVERLVNRLLASPGYGERWGRHWLDVVHYGDTHGYDKDKVRPNAWPYRDYVIRAFNEDKPYARFVREQLAGDVLDPGSAEGIIATGFIVAGPFDYVGQIEVREGTLEKAVTRNLDRDDMVASAMNTFNSMTVQCARCHNHKFDPILQNDYYALQAVFAGVDRADVPIDLDPQREQLRRRIAAIQADIAAPENEPPDTTAKEGPCDDRSGAAKSSDLTDELQALEQQLAALPAPALVFAAATDFPPEGQFTPTHGRARPVHVLVRGNEKSPGVEAAPGTAAYFSELPSRFDLPSGADEGVRRAALAEWLVDRDNALTWRSIVNRIWQHHFGRGIVDTANDFGRMGAAPTHPELLDWMATEFRDGGAWITTAESIKELHRVICASAVYRRSSTGDSGNDAVDAGNLFLWRANRRKLDAESLRDTVLAVAGCLDLAGGGPGFRNFGFEDDHSPRYKYVEHDPADPASLRRSVYRFIVRSAPDPFMTTLDCADASAQVGKRNETLTPLQALSLLNNPFMIAMSQRFAERAAALSSDRADQAAAAWRLALGREPTAEELATLREFAVRHGLTNTCRMIFNANEFMFVD